MRYRKFFVIYIAVFAAIAGFFVLKHAGNLVRYASYQGSGTAVVTKVDSKRGSGRHRHRKYRISYVFFVDDAEYLRASPWIGYNGLAPGQEAAVKFDPDDPEDSMLEAEMRDSAIALAAAGFVTAVVAGTSFIKSRAKRKARAMQAGKAGNAHG